MESEQIHASIDEPKSSHKVFRGIMLSFLFILIAVGFYSAFGQGIIEPFQREIQVKQTLEIDEDVITPGDGIRYQFKLIGETFTELFTFDKSEKERLNVRLIDERAKEMAILDAREQEVPESLVRNYSERIDRAERFVILPSDANENLDTREVVRSALEEHKIRFIDRINSLRDKPSNTVLDRVVDEFGDRITSIVARIDQDEVDLVKNTIPIIREKQQVIRSAEMNKDVELLQLKMKELEEIDDKLNRLHLSKLCKEPIRSLSLNTFEDVVRLCPIAKVMEDDIKKEFEQ